MSKPMTPIGPRHGRMVQRGAEAQLARTARYGENQPGFVQREAYQRGYRKPGLQSSGSVGQDVAPCDRGTNAAWRAGTTPSGRAGRSEPVCLPIRLTAPPPVGTLFVSGLAVVWIWMLAVLLYCAHSDRKP